MAAVLSLMLGSIMTVYGKETESGTAVGILKTVVTDIFHKHIGSPDAEGGCYTSPIPHVHKGDAASGGGCYTRPVPHQHTGSPTAGGGCYGKVIPHTTHVAECYRTETHTHEAACLGGICTITYTETGVIGTYTDTCPAHGETEHERRSATAHHSSCGLGTVDAVREVCKKCKDGLTRDHAYINCGKQEGSTSVLVCSKTIDGYEISCGYADGAAESYEPECSGVADGYELGCGLKEDKPVGKLILTSQAGSDSSKVVITARVEDLSGGKLILSNDPYIWRDGEGNLSGSGESLEVDKNGDYSVTVSLENKDVDKSGLSSSISVDSIPAEEQSPAPTATPKASPSLVPTASPSAAPVQTPVPSASPAETPDRLPEPTIAPEDGKDNEDGKGEEGNGDGSPEEENSAGTAAAKKSPEKKEEQKPSPDSSADASGDENGRASYYKKHSPAPTKTPEVVMSPSPDKTAKPKETLKKESETVTVSGNMAARDGQYKMGQTKKTGFFQSAAVRILTVTVSTVLLISGMLLLVLYLMYSARIYNDNGEGRMVYLGRRLIRKKDEEYSLVISEDMTERSCTNRYCIRPGLFRIGKKEGQELIVHRDTKKAVVMLEKEMIVNL